MRIRQIHHVALTHDTDSPLIALLTDACGLHVDHVEYGDGFTERMWPVGESYIQTLEATGAGVIAKSLASRGPGIHHIALVVDDIGATIAELNGRGIRLIDHEPRRVGQTLVAFVHPSAFGGVLVELVELVDDSNEPA